MQLHSYVNALPPSPSHTHTHTLSLSLLTSLQPAPRRTRQPSEDSEPLGFTRTGQVKDQSSNHTHSSNPQHAHAHARGQRHRYLLVTPTCPCIDAVACFPCLRMHRPSFPLRARTTLSTPSLHPARSSSKKARRCICKRHLCVKSEQQVFNPCTNTALALPFFSLTRPFARALRPAEESVAEAPLEHLVFEHVYGYQGKLARNNVAYLPSTAVSCLSVCACVCVRVPLCVLCNGLVS